MSDEAHSVHGDGDRRLALIFWTATATLLGFLALVHLGVLLSFLTTRSLLPWIAPAALGTALVAGDRLGTRQGLAGPARGWFVAVALGVIGLGIGVSVLFFDLSWDGQWYHQTAIYRMVQGWNPLADPLESFARHNQLFVRHYAKGPWYTAVAAMAATGSIEASKFTTWPALAAAFMSVTACGLDAGIHRGRAIALGGLVAMNPVALVEMLTFLVDGLMVCYLTCFGAALVRSIRKGDGLTGFVGFCAAVLAINSKFTGLVFLCFLLAGGFIHVLLRRRERLLRITAWGLPALLLGTVVWGYNPYVTNTLHRGQPFYPLLGSAEYPSMSAQGNDAIELLETPVNLKGRPRLVRFGYSLFGRPTAAPYGDDPEARLMWPFTARPGDMEAYRVLHDTRIAGFGPFFSGIFTLGLVLAASLLVSDRGTRPLMLLWGGVLLASLTPSVHLWWPRYGPQMWCLPVLAVLAAFLARGPRWRTGLAWGITGLMLVNAGLVFGAHLQWELASTRTLRSQLVQLRDEGRTIEIDLRYFGVPVGERLRRWGIDYEEVSGLSPEDARELMSVAEGIPGTIYYR